MRDPITAACTADAAARIAAHVHALCASGVDRNVGGAGNRAANAYFARVAETCGLAVERWPFACVAWEAGGVELYSGGFSFEAHPGPYSPPCDVCAPLAAAATIEELAAIDARGCILLVHGALAAEQLTPRRYPFYRTDAHERILAEIERQAPAALVAATARNPGLAGSMYPFPLINDADVDVPSAYMTDVDGSRLVAHVGRPVRLRVDSRRVPARSEQLAARKRGCGAGRILLMAHIDTAPGTPGALDNAAGVACLLALGERLATVDLRHTIELLPFNGEDNYAAPGEMAYIAACDGRFDDVTLAVNIDAAGYREAGTAVSHYGCPDDVVAAIARCVAGRERIVEGTFWPQSDHMIFAMRGVPAAAVTSEAIEQLCAEITHSVRDTPDLVDAALLAETVDCLLDVIAEVDELAR